MSVNFDQVISRQGSNAMAVHGFRDYLFGGEEVVLPCADDEVLTMWVADMAFASCPDAIEGMRRRLEHPIFGYTGLFDDELFDAYATWCNRRYGWTPLRAHFVNSPGIVPALYDFVYLFVGEGQKVLTLTPSYGFFQRAPTKHARELVTCGLLESEDGSVSVDFADFETKISDPNMRLFFLCHPHNPTGRVWSDDELQQMGDICLANNVMMVSDEIHCDLLRSGKTHTPLAKLFPDTDQIITCMSASKTFNLAGLGTANVIIPNEEMRHAWKEHVSPIVSPLGIAATAAVFRDGEDWLNELQSYLDANLAWLRDAIAGQLPNATFQIPDATYLAWINLSNYFQPDTNLTRFFAEQVGVLLEGGDMFVADAEGHVRLNVACPRSVLEDAFNRMVAAISAR